MLGVMEKNIWVQNCLLLTEFPVFSTYLLSGGRLQSSTGGSRRGNAEEPGLDLKPPVVNSDLSDNLFMGFALGNSPFYAKAGNEIQAAIS